MGFFKLNYFVGVFSIFGNPRVLLFCIIHGFRNEIVDAGMESQIFPRTIGKCCNF